MDKKEAVRRIKKAFEASRQQAAKGAAIALQAGLVAGTKGMKAGRKGLKAGLKAGSKQLKAAEKSGALERWRKRVALGLQALEVAAVATAAYKGASVKVGKAATRRPPARKTARKAPRRRPAR
jgi:hypothetical protein